MPSQRCQAGATQKGLGHENDRRTAITAETARPDHSRWFSAVAAGSGPARGSRSSGAVHRHDRQRRPRHVAGLRPGCRVRHEPAGCLDRTQASASRGGIARGTGLSLDEALLAVPAVGKARRAAIPVAGWHPHSPGTRLVACLSCGTRLRPGDRIAASPRGRRVSLRNLSRKAVPQRLSRRCLFSRRFQRKILRDSP